MITSSQNPRIQQMRALLAQHKARQSSRQFIVEGVRLMEEAWLSSQRPAALYFSAALSERGLKIVDSYRELQVEVEELTPSLMESLSQTEASQGILGVFPLRPLPLPEKPDFLLVIDNLRDPGNLGTMLRCAAAAGVQGVLLTPGTTEAFAPKVLRAGMGAHFRLPIHNHTWPEIQTLARRSSPPLRLLLSEVNDGESCWKLDLTRPLILVIGSEAEGATAEARAAADSLIHIPMPGQSESLNAAVAAGVLLFEVVRQRQQ
ncbi:MAG: RNA methyltransferase [Anaerolineae bacterium]|nr:RNA methyltransferase [Anaerolineae bacterium]